MFNQFKTATSDDLDQFLVGSSLMVVPIFSSNETYREKKIFFPDKFYDFRFGYEISRTGLSNYMVYESPLQLFIRFGHIVVVHQCENVNSATETMLRPMTLITGLDCSSNNSCHAEGILMIKHGISWTFVSNEGMVRQQNQHKFVS